MRRLCVIACAIVLLVSGCGASSPSGGATNTPVTLPAPVLDGTAAPSALTKFTCAAAAGGWAATGVVTNDSKASASFEVSVLVSTTGTGTAVTTQLENVPPKGTAAFSLAQIQASGDSPTCRVRVAKLN